MEQNREVIEADVIIGLARECLGTPWGHQGRICQVVMDCAGLPAHIFESLSLAYNDGKGYPRRPYRGMLEKILADQPHLVEVSKADLQAGDLVSFRISTSPQHIGIYTGKNVIHANATVGRVVEQPYKPWAPQLKNVYRFVK